MQVNELVWKRNPTIRFDLNLSGYNGYYYYCYINRIVSLTLLTFVPIRILNYSSACHPMQINPRGHNCRT